MALGPIRAWAPVTLIIAALGGYIIWLAIPVWETASAVRVARRASKEFPQKQLEIEGKNPAERHLRTREAAEYLDGYIVGPLYSAARNDRDNPAILIEAAYWWRLRWKYALDLQRPDEAKYDREQLSKLLDRAHTLDPKDHRPWYVFFDTTIMRHLIPEGEPAQIEAANRWLRELIARRPDLEWRLRYRMAMTFLERGNAEGVQDHIIRLLQARNEIADIDIRSEEYRRMIVSVRRLLKNPKQELAELLRTQPEK